jgi:DNA-binding FadR family transcriptional regulator
VSVRVGAGVQVLDASAPRAASASADEPPVGPLDLLEARLVVETETAALAARHATEQDLQGLQRSLDQMVQDHARNPLLHDGDRAFHIGIARASGNAALLFIVTTLWDQRYTPMQDRMETLFTTPGLHTAAVDDHRRVLEAIAAHDPAAARQAMRRHLTTVRKTFSRAIVAGR